MDASKRSRSLVWMLFASAVAVPMAGATTITFGGVADYGEEVVFGGAYDAGEYQFLGASNFRILSDTYPADQIDNGTDYGFVQGPPSFTLTRIDGAAFALRQFDAASAFSDPGGDLTVSATTVGGGTPSVTLSTVNGTFTTHTFHSQWSNVLSVTVTAAGNFLAIDNVVLGSPAQAFEGVVPAGGDQNFGGVYSGNGIDLASPGEIWVVSDTNPTDSIANGTDYGWVEDPATVTLETTSGLPFRMSSLDLGTGLGAAGVVTATGADLEGNPRRATFGTQLGNFNRWEFPAEWDRMVSVTLTSDTNYLAIDNLVLDPTVAPEPVLYVPYFKIDPVNPSGTTTLFAVRNLDDEPVEVHLSYVDVVDELRATETFTLEPNETFTRNARDVAGLAGHPEGFVRIHVPRGAKIGGDFFQVDVAGKFATGERLVTDAQLCRQGEIRFLNFGSGSTLRILLDDPDFALSSQFSVHVFDESGTELGTAHIANPSHVLETSDVAILAAAGVTANFGTLKFDFTHSLRGFVTGDYSADGLFSVGVDWICTGE